MCNRDARAGAMPTLRICHARKASRLFRRPGSLVAWPRRIAAHRPGSGDGEGRLRVLGHLDKCVRTAAVVDPGVDRLQEVDAAWKGRAIDAADARAAVVCARRDVEAHELVDGALAELCDDAPKVFDSRKRALGEIRHVLFKDQLAAAPRE